MIYRREAFPRCRDVPSLPILGSHGRGHVGTSQAWQPPAMEGRVCALAHGGSDAVVALW